MSTFGLIYITGSIIAFILVIYNAFKDEEVITVKDLVMILSIAFCASVFSWIGLFICIITFYEDVVIYRRKNNYDKENIKK